jgi:hypothetical protein
LEGIYKESPYCEKQNYTYRPRCQDWATPSKFEHSLKRRYLGQLLHLGISRIKGICTKLKNMMQKSLEIHRNLSRFRKAYLNLIVSTTSWSLWILSSSSDRSGIVGRYRYGRSSPNSKDTDIGLPTALWFLHWYLQRGLELNGCSCGFDSGGDTRVSWRWAEYEYETPRYEYDESGFRGFCYCRNSLTSLHPFFNAISLFNTRLSPLPAPKRLKVQIVRIHTRTNVKNFANEIWILISPRKPTSSSPCPRHETSWDANYVEWATL